MDFDPTRITPRRPDHFARMSAGARRQQVYSDAVIADMFTCDESTPVCAARIGCSKSYVSAVRTKLKRWETTRGLTPGAWIKRSK